MSTSVSALDIPVGPSVPRVPALTESDLENLIECWRLIGTLESDRELQGLAFKRMRKLIAMRTPETIARMEQAKGLR